MWLSIQCVVAAILAVNAFSGTSGSEPNTETENPRRVEGGTEGATSSEEDVGRCWNRRGFQNLSRCMAVCGEATELRPSVRAKRGSSSSLYYKVIHLDEYEYEIEDDDLRMRFPFPKTRRIFRRGEYVVSRSGTAYACHPLSKEITKCDKWQLEPNEYTIYDNETLQSIHQETYEFNEYFVLDNDNAVTCSLEENDMDDTDNYATLLVPGTTGAICLAILLILV